MLEYLARLSEGQGPSPAQGLSSLAGTGRVLAIVSAMDVEGLEAVSRLPAARLASVVVLRGFAPQEEGVGSLAMLNSAGVPVITCVPGGIQETLHELAGVGALGPQHVVHKPSRASTALV